MLDKEVLENVRSWNLDQMKIAQRQGRDADAWRHSDNAEQLRKQIG